MSNYKRTQTLKHMINSGPIKMMSTRANILSCLARPNEKQRHQTTHAETSLDRELMLMVDVCLSWGCEERQHTVQRLIETMV